MGEVHEAFFKSFFDDGAPHYLFMKEGVEMNVNTTAFGLNRALKVVIDEICHIWVLGFDWFPQLHLRCFLL